MKLSKIITVLAAVTCLGVKSTIAEEPKTAGEKLVSELWAKVYNLPQDLDVIDRVCTEDVILTSSGRDVVGRAAFKEWARNFSRQDQETSS